MSKRKGQEIFEIPSEEDLAEYIHKGKKVIQHIEEGKTPIYFKPKRQHPKITFTIIFILVLSSSVIIMVPAMISIFSSINPSTNQTTTQTTYTTQTTIPSGEDPVTLSQSVNQLETFLYQFIPENYSNFAPFMENNSINTSKRITFQEILDFIWLLSQDRDSEWRDLGRNLLYTEYRIWENTSIETESLDLKAHSLRALLSYPQKEVPLIGTEKSSYENRCSLLWNSIKEAVDITSNTISFQENVSIRIADEQIIFLDILCAGTTHGELFNYNELQGYAKNILETLDEIITNINGIPEDFFSNLTEFNPIYSFKDQGHLFLALHALDHSFDLGSLAQSLIQRLDSFIWNYLTRVDWSCNSYYNNTSHKGSNVLASYDQGLMIRNHILMDRLSSANYTANTLRQKLSMSNGGYIISNIKNSSAYLIDQVQILVAFKELIELKNAHESTTGPSMASFWGLQPILIMIIGLSIKRLRERKRKR
ncbi:MAG: hypothetical protein EAX86_05270 [Candidatus Heimdallarchaeota archaeon]|nr:hypothetical protein [Candidatus Heimdallarchaeota archaeon]